MLVKSYTARGTYCPEEDVQTNVRRAKQYGYTRLSSTINSLLGTRFVYPAKAINTRAFQIPHSDVVQCKWTPLDIPFLSLIHTIWTSALSGLCNRNGFSLKKKKKKEARGVTEHMKRGRHFDDDVGAGPTTSLCTLLGSDTLYKRPEFGGRGWGGDVVSNFERNPTFPVLISLLYAPLYLFHVHVSLFVSLIFPTHFFSTSYRPSSITLSFWMKHITIILSQQALLLRIVVSLWHPEYRLLSGAWYTLFQGWPFL